MCIGSGMDAALGQAAQLNKYQQTGNPADFPGAAGATGTTTLIRPSVDMAQRFQDARTDLTGGLGSSGTGTTGGKVLGSTK